MRGGMGLLNTGDAVKIKLKSMQDTTAAVVIFPGMDRKVAWHVGSHEFVVHVHPSEHLDLAVKLMPPKVAAPDEERTALVRRPLAVPDQPVLVDLAVRHPVVVADVLALLAENDVTCRPQEFAHGHEHPLVWLGDARVGVGGKVADIARGPGAGEDHRKVAVGACKFKLRLPLNPPHTQQTRDRERARASICVIATHHALCRSSAKVHPVRLRTPADRGVPK